MLLRISDVLEHVGCEFGLLKIWYHILLVPKDHIQWARYEPSFFMNLRLFLDRPNIVSLFNNSLDIMLTETEKTEWTQRVARYAGDPPSQVPPLRPLLNRQAGLLIVLGDYKSALCLFNSAPSQAKQFNDKESKAISVVLIAIVKGRLHDVQDAIDMLAALERTSPLGCQDTR
jgi:hypothetical protein